MFVVELAQHVIRIGLGDFTRGDSVGRECNAGFNLLALAAKVYCQSHLFVRSLGVTARVAWHLIQDLTLKIDKHLTVVGTDIQRSGCQGVIGVSDFYVVEKPVNLAVPFRYFTYCARQFVSSVPAHRKILALALL